ncbi:alpha/beta fold hydrolase [Pseudahrensia aquimaris]|uniref:Alpha/beta fold hydrolase n=1 Tax=Pseudahrensia aquimaris TaxID=744461 RepID=A0ABW3FAU7_9HYPH
MERQKIKFTGAEGNNLIGDLYEPPQQDNSAPPALFLHGGGQTRHSWRGAAKQLAHLGIASITMDARGHGDSDWVQSKDYSIEGYQADTVALSDHLAQRFGTRPILIGASLGGLSGMMAVKAAGPSVFSAQIFVDITPTMLPSGVDRIQGFMAEKMHEGFNSVEEAADAIAIYLPDRPRPKSLDGLRKNLRQREDGRFYWHWDPAFIDGPHPINKGRETRGAVLQEACRQITAPTLLIRGSRSELVTEAAAKEFQELVPHARFVDVTDAGHMVAGDRNDVFANAVIDFLKREVI